MKRGKSTIQKSFQLLGCEKKLRKQVNKNIFYEKVGGMTTIGGVKSKETRSYQKGKCNSPIFSTETTHALEMC